MSARTVAAYVYGEYLQISRPSVRVRYIGTSRRLGCPLGLSMGSGELYCLDTGARLGERATRIPKLPVERSDDAAWRTWAASCFGAVASLGKEDQAADTVDGEVLT